MSDLKKAKVSSDLLPYSLKGVTEPRQQKYFISRHPAFIEWKIADILLMKGMHICQ